MQFTDDQYYQALLEKNSQFEGVIYVGVKTTGIFCKPTCRARKPKRENVEFFKDVKSAMAYGYRPCKVCKPMQNSGETPDSIKVLLKELEQHPEVKITDWGLKQRQLEPHAVRRWFKKQHNMTFQAYQRMLRINRAAGALKKGDTVSNAAYDNGFESLSGFHYSFKKMTAVNPGESSGKPVVTLQRIATPLGPMLAGVVENELCLLEFTDRRMLESQLKILETRLGAIFIYGNHPILDHTQLQLQEYFDGRRSAFQIPMALLGTTFQQQVWQALLTIPPGQTRSYKAQAAAIGNPNAVRAVAKANGDNRISILIPCHRVIGEDGHLTGYGGGLGRKQWLLEHEKRVGQAGKAR